MHSFQFYSPTKVLFGAGTITEAGPAVQAAGGRRILVLYGGGSVVTNGVLDTVLSSLDQCGITYFVEGGIRPNPLLSKAQQLLEQYAQQDIDFLLGVGGASVLDTCKAVAMGLYGGGPIWDYFTKTRPVTGAVPVGCVLTIAAAGSETSDSAVLTNEALSSKRGCSTPFNRPLFAIMDPETTYTLSPYQTACGVADIMLHTMERYFGADAGENQLTDGIAEALLRDTMENGVRAMKCPSDYHARSELMWCGSLSHNDLTGLGRPKDMSVHQLGHPLSAVYKLAHGASLTAIWPHWARYVVQSDPARFARLGRTVLGLSEPDDQLAAEAAIQGFSAYWKQLDLPICFQDCISAQNDEALHTLVRLCSYDGTRSIGAFCKLDETDMLAIYQMANRT